MPVAGHPALRAGTFPTRLPVDERASVRFVDDYRVVPQLVNCWAAANPGRPPDQTLRWTGDPGVPYHCDGVFVPAGWRDRLLSCAVLAGDEGEALSDHNPVVARFEVVRVGVRPTPAESGRRRRAGPTLFDQADARPSAKALAASTSASATAASS